MSLCPECQTLYDGWLTYQAPARGWVTLNNYERSTEARHAQLRERRELVRRQLDMIVDSCRRKHAGTLDQKPNLG